MSAASTSVRLTPAQRRALLEWFDVGGLLNRNINGRNRAIMDALTQKKFVAFLPVTGRWFSFSCLQLTLAGHAERRKIVDDEKRKATDGREDGREDER